VADKSTELKQEIKNHKSTRIELDNINVRISRQQEKL